jgi:hypothetical protein
MVIGIAFSNSASKDSSQVQGLSAITIKGHYGFIWAHKQNVNHLVNGHVSTIEIEYQLWAGKRFRWESYFNYPEVGVSALFGSLGSKDQLGSGSALFGYAKFPLINKGKIQLSYKWGSGLGMVGKPFDPVKNYKNIAIGSQLNMFMQLQLETRIQLCSHAVITSGLGFSHYSNGAFKVPNLGLNVPTFYLGFASTIGSKNEAQPIPTITEDDTSKMEFSCLGAYAIKEIHPAGGGKYHVFHFEGDAMIWAGKRRKLGLGLDIYHDGATIDEYNSDLTTNYSDNTLEFIRYGVHFTHELMMGRFSAITQLGVYLHTKYKNDGPIYHRFAYRYYFDNKLFIDLGLKTHWGVAQNIAVGVGYKF